jgi:hypothetical protein
MKRKMEDVTPPVTVTWYTQTIKSRKEDTRASLAERRRMQDGK